MTDMSGTPRHQAVPGTDDTVPPLEEARATEHEPLDTSTNTTFTPGPTPITTTTTTVGGSSGDDRSWQLFGALGALAALLVTVLGLRRRRTPPPPPPTPGEKLALATQAAGAASVALGKKVAHRVSEAAEPAGETAAELARRGAHAGAEAAERAVAVAVPALRTAGEAGKELAGSVTHTLVEVPATAVASAAGTVTGAAGAVAGSVAEAAEELHGWWRKVTHRLLLLLFGGTGYVLGARAGRERYDQIVASAQRLSQR